MESCEILLSPWYPRIKKIVSCWTGSKSPLLAKRWWVVHSEFTRDWEIVWRIGCLIWRVHIKCFVVCPESAVRPFCRPCMVWTLIVLFKMSGSTLCSYIFRPLAWQIYGKHHSSGSKCMFWESLSSVGKASIWCWKLNTAVCQDRFHTPSEGEFL